MRCIVACYRLLASVNDHKSEQATSGISCKRDPGVKRPVRIVLETSFCPLEKKKLFLLSNCQMSKSRCVQYRVTCALIFSVLCSSAIVYVCCVSVGENIFECGSLYVGVQKINYRQIIRPIWWIKTMILHNRAKLKQWQKQHTK